MSTICIIILVPIVEGSINNCTSCLNINCPLQINNSFREQLDEYSHRGDTSESPYKKIPNMYSSRYSNICTIFA